MFELNFAVEQAEPVQFAATPTLAFTLRITSTSAAQPIHNVLLQCQIQIETTRRKYNDAEQQNLVELFGEPDRWGGTLRALLWTHGSVTVPAFENETLVTLHIPCTFDFNVAATKYFHGLADGDVPLNFLFSGSIFYAAEDRSLQIARIAWEKDAQFRLPVGVWRQMMDHYYPNSAWLCLPRDTFAALQHYKHDHGIATWEQAVESLLSQRGGEQRLEPLAQCVSQ